MGDDEIDRSSPVYQRGYKAGTMALVLILFDGGLNTSASALRLAIKPAGVLASLGVGLGGADSLPHGRRPPQASGTDWPAWT